MPASGLKIVTKGELPPLPRLTCVSCGNSVSLRTMLATTINSLALASRSTTGHWLPCGILSRPVLLSPFNFSLFSQAFLAFFSTFAYATKFAIGLELYLALEVSDSHLHTSMSARATPEHCTPQPIFTYAAVTLYRTVFQRSSANGLALKAGPKPHICHRLTAGIRFALYPLRSHY